MSGDDRTEFRYPVKSFLVMNILVDEKIVWQICTYWLDKND
jgi:hypothetical protein